MDGLSAATFGSWPEAVAAPLAVFAPEEPPLSERYGTQAQAYDTWTSAFPGGRWSLSKMTAFCLGS